MEHLDIVNFNSWAKKHITGDSKFDEDGFIIMENNNNYESAGTIAKIFEDHWDNYYSRYKVTIDKTRPNVNKEVNKIISCSNHKLGATVYCCQDCGEVIFSHHTCKGKLCSSCGIKTQKIRTENILEKCVNVKHKQ